jgi:hypothetical protein
MERLNAEVMKKTHESGCGLRRKYGAAEKSGEAHFSARFIFLPSFRQAGLPRHSPESLRGDGASHRVAVSRSDKSRNERALSRQMGASECPGSATVPVAVRGVSRRTSAQRCVWRDAKHGARDARAPNSSFGHFSLDSSEKLPLITAYYRISKIGQ